MQYNQDRRFFHTFEGDQFLIAFSFAEEKEADDFFKKVHGRSKYGESRQKNQRLGLSA